jgi:NAD(P)-dependent dehydrogenase (short-subunit alcohol dehydrogenase family)
VLIEGKVGIVTGAASGMGRAASRLFAREGARVVCADVNREGASETAKGIEVDGGSASAVRLDVANRSSCEAAVREAIGRFERVDFLVNFGGVWDGRDTGEIDDAHWNFILDVNLKGSFLICQAVAPVMIAQRYGRIVLIGSIAARVGGAMGGPHYAASKGGVISLTRALARRMGRHHVTVNSINPGPVESAMTAGWSSQAKDEMVRSIPLGRLGQPIDIASAALFLVSDLSSWMTGETLEVNGGLYFG